MQKCFLLSSLFLLGFTWACTSQAPTAAAPPAYKKSGPGAVFLADSKNLDSLCFPTVFEAAFRKGTRVKQATENYTFTTINLGDLTSITGKIIAGDPVVLADRPAFTQRFPTGKFPVQLALAKLADDERVGFARILFSANRVANWQLALLPGQKPVALKDSVFYCYGVDAGMGIFTDSLANQHFAWNDRATWEKVFITQTAQPDYRGYIHSFDGYNLATFSTGLGDGCYATYIGFDTQGNVCQLITDFGLVVW